MSQHSPTWEGPPNLPITNQNTFPDPLIPFIDPATGLPPTPGATYVAAPTNLAAGNNIVFWVDTYVPRGTTAGLYTGTYTVSSDQGSVTGQISVKVWNFTLPLKTSLHTNFNGGNVTVDGGNAEMMRNRLRSTGLTSTIWVFGAKSLSAIATCPLRLRCPLSRLQ